MPKLKVKRNKKGEYRLNPMGSKSMKSFKRIINDSFISEIIRDSNITDILYKWLRGVRGKYSTTKGKPMISKEQLKNELIQGLMLLNSDLQQVKASPKLSEAELEGLDVTPELAKFQKLKKDKWMNDYINGNISDWLLDSEIIDVLNDTGNETTTNVQVIDSIQKYNSNLSDEWSDIGVLYGEYTGKDISPIGIEINTGKIKGGKDLIFEIFDSLAALTKEGISNALSKLMEIGLFIPLKISGYVIKISTEIVLNTLLGIIKSNPRTNMLINTFHSLFGPAFTISDDVKSVRDSLDTKYKVLLALTFQKTLLNLSLIVSGGVLDSKNIVERLNTGLRVLDYYINGFFDEFSDKKIEITNVMFSFDKLIEWYLMRRTIAVYNTTNETLLLEDVPLSDRGRRGKGADISGERTEGSAMKKPKSSKRKKSQKKNIPKSKKKKKSKKTKKK